jgi:hypothetical protein
MPVIVERAVISYRNVNLYQIVANQPRILLRCVYGLDNSPTVRGKDSLIPSAAGLVARNRVRGVRRIVLEGFVMGVGTTHDDQRADLRSIVELLRDAFDPTAAAAELEVQLEDGNTATIDARAMPEEPEWGPDTMPTARTLSIELEAVGADWVLPGS